MKRPTGIIGLLILLAGCGDQLCDHELIDKTVDTDGKHVAYLYARNCGATTDYAAVIAVGAPGKAISDSDVVFIADSDHGAAQTDGKIIWLNMQWTRPGALFVTYAKAARVFKSLGHADGATIRYRLSERYSPPPPSAIR